VRSALAGLQPSWRDTDLGRALITAAESVEDAATQQREQAPREIVVISDLQSGSRIESLQGFQWPDGVRVRLERIGAASAPTNAGVHLVTEGNDTAAGLRVRVTNVDDATRETFRLRWVDEFAAPSSSPTRGTASATTDASGPTESIVAEAVAPHAPHVDVYVPPGQGRVVRAPPLPEDHPSSRLVLSGDDHAFDNTAFVAHRRARDVTIVYLGSDHADDPAELRFFLEPLFPSTHERTVHVLDWAFESTTLPESAHGVALVIVTEPPRADQIATLREFADKGGTVVYVARSAESAASIYELAGAAPVPVTEATVRGYAMLTDVDFRHPVFAPLSDPRFSDFTKLHFWKHRRIDAAALPDCRVLARFDDGDPAIGEVPLGRGRLVFFASGWGRDDSQLAVWSKFVPLMNALLEYGSGPLGQAAQYLVGEPVPLETLFGARTTVTAVRLPDGTEQPIPAGTTVFDAADVPGIYTFTAAAGDGTQSEVRVAVNLAPAESRTSPLTAEALESAGVRFLQSDSPSALQAAAERERQLQNHELENRQKLWRWLIVAAIAVLVLETLVAGRLAARRTESA
jgi:hypothetical protein